MRQIPGNYIDFKETVEITPEEESRWHQYRPWQAITLMVIGCPGIGVKKEKIFAEKGYTWKASLKPLKKGMTEDAF